jgi:tRNA nucleotidyltransferase (CCA-adding enzyme)
MPDFPITPEVERIGRAVAKAGGRPILVGGWVRDCLLGHPHSKDFDIEVFRLTTAELQAVLAPFGPVHTVGRHFGVLKLSTREAEYDISVPRRESKIGVRHKDFAVTADPGMSFEEAAARRDFTINSIGFAFLERETLDPYRGQEDLARRILRHTGPAFGEDPLRVLRAMQFAGRFGMTIAPETIDICRQQDLSHLPAERIWEELRKLLLLSPAPSRGLRYARALNVLPYFPEWEAMEALGETALDGGLAEPAELTRGTVDRAAAQRGGAGHEDLVLMFAAWTHLFGLPGLDAANPTAIPLAEAAESPIRRFLSRLTREVALPDQVVTLVRALPAPGVLFAERAANPDPAIRRLTLRVHLPLLLKLARARHEARHAPGAAPVFAAGDWLAGRARALGVYAGPPAPLLKGRHLLELGLKPGPGMGPLLERAFQRQLDGAFATLDDALDWARSTLKAGRGS